MTDSSPITITKKKIANHPFPRMRKEMLHNDLRDPNSKQNSPSNLDKIKKSCHGQHRVLDRMSTLLSQIEDRLGLSYSPVDTPIVCSGMNKVSTIVDDSEYALLRLQEMESRLKMVYGCL